MKHDDWQILESKQLPDGLWMVLGERALGDDVEREYRLTVGGCVLMQLPCSRYSAQRLAEVGIQKMREQKRPSVLIGGLGFGITLGKALDLLGPGARVIVSELYPEIVDWNRKHFVLGEGGWLTDARATVVVEDVKTRIDESEDEFDLILLDVDNGPVGFHGRGNDRLYSREGVAACKRALRSGGVLAVWSGFDSADYERRLLFSGLLVRKHLMQNRAEEAVIFLAGKP